MSYLARASVALAKYHTVIANVKSRALSWIKIKKPSLLHSDGFVTDNKMMAKGGY